MLSDQTIVAIVGIVSTGTVGLIGVIAQSRRAARAERIDDRRRHYEELAKASIDVGKSLSRTFVAFAEATTYFDGKHTGSASSFESVNGFDSQSDHRHSRELLLFHGAPTLVLDALEIFYDIFRVKGEEAIGAIVAESEPGSQAPSAEPLVTQTKSELRTALSDYYRISGEEARKTLAEEPSRIRRYRDKVASRFTKEVT